MNKILYWLRHRGSTVTLLLLSYGIMALFFIVRFNKLPPQIPLYYSRVTGEEQIADAFYLLLIPLLSTAIVMLNRIIANKLFSDNEFMKQIIYYTDNITILFFTIIFLRILFLVT